MLGFRDFWKDAWRDIVAILTDPGGPVLVVLLPVDRHRVAVAILTDPGGPVLECAEPPHRRPVQVLRSSPTPEGRCWLTRPGR